MRGGGSGERQIAGSGEDHAETVLYASADHSLAAQMCLRRHTVPGWRVRRVPPETAEQAANRVADRAMAGKHNNAQRSQASPGADSVQERVVQRQVDTVEVIHRSA